ncbi:endonuclease [Bacillus paranthracis]|uniref:endonuclease n=1 Tax=Bacillus paranthracis TaxID=2026186 RepID=UPI001879958B|nr:endonuclease [Bacillus paranthracis]MBE7114472.1 endonuclease [Bacillus paranthracis]MBE7154654.1 endonuclease [Bacillus paranthracis]
MAKSRDITKEDVEVWKKEYESGASLRKIGETHNVDKTTVKYHLKGVVEFREKSPFKKYADEWHQLHLEGWTNAAIAKKYNVTTTTVWNILSKEKGVKKKVGRKKYAHLLPTFIQMYKDGADLTDISKATGASRQTVLNYLNDEGIKARTYSETSRIHEVKEDYFEVIDSDRKAYMLGLVFSSGTLLEHHGTKSLQVSGANTKAHVIGEIFGELTDRKLGDIMNDGNKYKDRIFSPKLYMSLKRLGMGFRGEMAFPDLTGSYRSEFLRGYLVGRVTLDEKLNNLFVAARPNNVGKLRDMLVQIVGVNSDAIKSFTGSDDRLVIYRNAEVAKVMEFVKKTD